jgi:hypothetical protein
MESFFANTSVGAFLGSFTAFVFGILAYGYTKKREKWVTHHNALVKIEQLVNRHLNEITGNIFLLKGSIETYAKSAFSENELSPLENPDYMIDFHNINLINMYQDYQAFLEKVNHDLLAWNRSNDRLFNVALSGKVPPADIEANRKELSRRSKVIIRHLEDLLQETYSTGAFIREFMKVDKRDLFARLGPTEKIELTHKQLKIERNKFIKERENTMEKDRKGRLSKYNKDEA